MDVRHSPGAKLTERKTEADPLSQTSTSKRVMETSEKAKKVEWKREPTHLLIETHGIYNHLFNMGTVSNVEVWRKIASVLQDKGYPYTPDDCRKKWNSLFYRYKLVKRNKSKRGNKHTKWEHYDVMDDYMTGKPINTPPKVKETSLPIAIISEDPPKRLRFVENLIVPPQVVTQSIEEISDKARRIEWKRDQTHLLIDAHRTFEHLFIVGNVSSVKVWRKIAKVLQNKGYPYTPDDCRKKWNSLIYRYKLVKRNKTQSGNKRTKWEHYDVMDKYMAGEPILTPPAEETSLSIDPDHPQPSTSSVIECKQPTPAPNTLHIKEALSFPSSLTVAMPTGSSILAKPSPPGDMLSHTPSPPEVLHHPRRKHDHTQLRDKNMRLEVTEEVLEQQEGSSSKQEHVRESAILRNALMDNYTREAVKYHQQLSSQLQEQQEQILQLKQQQQSHHEVQQQQILQLQQQSQNQNEMLQQHGMQLQAIMGMLQDMKQYFKQERSQGEKKK